MIKPFATETNPRSLVLSSSGKPRDTFLKFSVCASDSQRYETMAVINRLNLRRRGILAPAILNQPHASTTLKPQFILQTLRTMIPFKIIHPVLCEDGSAGATQASHNLNCLYQFSRIKFGHFQQSSPEFFVLAAVALSLSTGTSNRRRDLGPASPRIWGN